MFCRSNTDEFFTMILELSLVPRESEHQSCCWTAEGPAVESVCCPIICHEGAGFCI